MPGDPLGIPGMRQPGSHINVGVIVEMFSLGSHIRMIEVANDLRL